MALKKITLLAVMAILLFLTSNAQVNNYYTYWKFDANFNDESSNSNDGTPFSSPVFVQDRNDNATSAIKLDGVDDYIRVANDNNLSLAGSFSISFWIKPYTYGQGGYGRIIEKRDDTSNTGFHIYLSQTTNGISFTRIGTQILSFENCVDLNQWQQFTFTYDGTTLKGFKNTTLINSYPLTPLVVTSVDLLIGQATSMSRAFNGEIDDIYIFDRVITDNEISLLFQTGTSLWSKTGNDIYYSSGNVGIGTSTPDPDTKLDVAGTIRAKEIRVEDIAAINMNLSGDIAANSITLKANGNTADFVFEEDYQLKDLSEVETFIRANKHLPGVPNATQMEEQGVNLAEMNKLLLQKVEELTLYMIQQQKEINSLKCKITNQASK